MTNAAQTILIVEDELRLADILEQYLRAGFSSSLRSTCLSVASLRTRPQAGAVDIQGRQVVVGRVG